MSNLKNTIEEGCNLPSSNNELEILIKQLKREVISFYRDTTEHLLKHDDEITGLCNKIKDNLSNELRELLDTMLSTGEIDELIKHTLFNNVPLNIKDFRMCR